MVKLESVGVGSALFVLIAAVGGCNGPSLEDYQQLESELAQLRTRVEASEARSKANATLADLALDSSGQCNQICLRVSDRLDELFLQTVPR